MRCVNWKHRLKYIIALSSCLVLTMVVYLNLPDASTRSTGSTYSINSINAPSRHHVISKQESDHILTVVIREFEEFENVLSQTVNGIEKHFSTVDILIIADRLPYPPVNLTFNKSTRILKLSSDLSQNYSSSCPWQFLKSEFVLFIPDGVRINDLAEIMKLSSVLTHSNDIKAVVFAVGNEHLECSALHVNVKEWTVSFQGNMTQNPLQCAYVEGPHALLMKTDTLKSLAEPFAKPFPYSFFIQATLKRWNVQIVQGDKFTFFHTFLKDFHSLWKHKQAQAESLNEFYKKIGIKREILKSGLSNFYGCTKKTARCFGTVVKDMPQYLYEGKWSPPCCLRALRESVAHVFEILEKCKVRYWLEGGSLLGAARHGDIIPWDYDVDIGIYADDLDKCHHLRQAKLESYIDDEDYVWEKAREGEFYRVQYSETNHLHVDIFPFYSKGGIMTKNTWFSTHPQDTEFPETFLTPLTRIKFAGIEASAPNNVRKFLEYKFGKNVIENPRYPDKQLPYL